VTNHATLSVKQLANITPNIPNARRFRDTKSTLSLRSVGWTIPGKAVSGVYSMFDGLGGYGFTSEVRTNTDITAKYKSALML
ncbi:12221_t:CDS:1, partial [Acaulospora morrowiae]